jgi:galactokinase
MSGRALGERLVARGLDPAELNRKAELFDSVLDPPTRRATRHAVGDHSRTPAARRFGGASPAGSDAARTSRAMGIWWAPGRLEVFGKHTDYAGGRTLVAAVPRGFVVSASARVDGWLHVFDAKRRESISLRAEEDFAAPRTGWRHYVEVVAHRLAANFPGASIGADVVFASDLPRASGMSSSSALIVGLAVALVRAAGLDSRPEWRANVRDRFDEAGYYACIENGRTFGTLTGDAGVGTHGGSEDHAAILTARPGELTAFSFVPMRLVDSVALTADWRFVAASCGVPSQKTGPAMVPYNRLSEGTRVLLDLWNATGPAAESLHAALQTGADAHARLRTLVRRASVDGWSSAALERRLDHFVREDGRVLQAFEAFRHGDARRLDELSRESQIDAEVLLGNQIPETIALARRARDCGAFAACSFGAGFGGSAWALVDRGDAQRFLREWHPDAFLATPGPSLTEL